MVHERKNYYVFQRALYCFSVVTLNKTSDKDDNIAKHVSDLALFSVIRFTNKMRIIKILKLSSDKI